MKAAIALAARLDQAGHHQAAQMAYRAAEGAFDDDALTWFQFGTLLQDARESAAAIEAYRAALAINFEHASSHLNLAILLRGSGQYTQALSSFEMVLKLDPTRLNFCYLMAEVAWQAGKPRDALTLLDMSVDAGLKVAFCLDLKARLALQAREFAEVISLAQASWDLVAEDDWAQLSLINAYDSALYALGRGAEGPISSRHPEVTLAGVVGAWEELAAACPGFAALLPIHVIGDSHSNFFTGLNYHHFCAIGAPQMLPGFRAYNIGAKLAYTLEKARGSGERGGPLFELLASGRIPHGATLMLSFGEIDGRMHVLKQAEQQGRPVEEIQEEIVRIYVASLERVRAMGFRPMVWTPCGGTPDDNPIPHLFPTYGSMIERNRACRHFIAHLAGECNPRGIPVLSIFDDTVDAALTTDPRWLIDGVHLNQRAMAPTLSAFRAAFGDGARL